MKKILLPLMSIFLLIFVTSCKSSEAGYSIQNESDITVKSTGETSLTEEDNIENISEAIIDSYDFSSEIIDVTSFDGYTFKGRLTLPSGRKDISKLIIYINGSGINTYENHRKIDENTEFNYYDFFADEFSSRGAAFFSYNTRGVGIGENPPIYADVNWDEYQTYLPSNSVEDVYHMIKTIKANERLAGAKVYLLGWSEGTIIAPLVVEKYPDLVNGLLLAGYANQNMKDILIWQNSGGSSMIWYNHQFDLNGDGCISKSEYELDRNGIVPTILQNMNFEDIDYNGDGVISEEDFAPILKETLDSILLAIENGDDEWLRNNYGGGLITLTSAWFLEHFSLRSNVEVLPKLDLPIYIFHGTLDQNCDVDEVYNIGNIFKSLDKTNLTINIFSLHNHDLNYEQIVFNNEIPEGIQAILDTVEGL